MQLRTIGTNGRENIVEPDKVKPLGPLKATNDSDDTTSEIVKA